MQWEVIFRTDRHIRNHGLHIHVVLKMAVQVCFTDSSVRIVNQLYVLDNNIRANAFGLYRSAGWRVIASCCQLDSGTVPEG